jgi:hypothetical protein
MRTWIVRSLVPFVAGLLAFFAVAAIGDGHLVLSFGVAFAIFGSAQLVVFGRRRRRDPGRRKPDD